MVLNLVDLFKAIISSVITLSSEPITNWYQNKDQFVVTNKKQFEKFLQDVSTVNNESAEKGKSKLAAEFEKIVPQTKAPLSVA